MNFCALAGRWANPASGSQVSWDRRGCRSTIKQERGAAGGGGVDSMHVHKGNSGGRGAVGWKKKIMRKKRAAAAAVYSACFERRRYRGVSTLPMHRRPPAASPGRQGTVRCWHDWEMGGGVAEEHRGVVDITRRE